MKYICQFVGGDMNGTISLEDAEKLTANRSEDLSALRNKGCLVRMKELDNKPVFKGYLGPMWDGTRENGTVAVLRYETQRIYDTLSR